MAKNVVICLDGTGNEIKARGNTNVFRLFGLLDRSDPTRQVGYYDPGVGTFTAPGAWTPPARLASRLAGLAVGSGLRTNLAEAYVWLMHHYEPGDRIYVIGFSRGAYTARALTGLVRTLGVFRPGSENVVQYAVSAYCRRDQDDDGWDQLREFQRTFGHRVDGRFAVPVEFVGVWDTVKSAGVLRWDVKWPYTRKVANVRTIRHAVSIDEKRRPYAPYRVEVHPRSNPVPVVDEVWFAGVHSDVGGTFPDPRLSDITLKWMTEGAVAAGLLVDAKRYADFAARVTPDSALGTVNTMHAVWGLLGYKQRTVPPGARVHASVRDRIATHPAYGDKLPSDVEWVDPGWAAPVTPAAPVTTR